MRHVLPQFIEYEAKIIGPLTFGQFLFIGLAGAVCFVLFFIIRNLVVFFMAVAVIMGISFAFAFVKIDNRPLSSIVGNVLRFFLGSKMYVWNKKEARAVNLDKEKDMEIPIIKRIEVVPKTEEVEPKPVLGTARESQLKKIRTDIETKTK